ncbi:MAG: hypothetical protein ACTSWC_13165 [Promethearchaeota archaeon]
MSKIGPFSPYEIGDKLQKIPLDEMKAYHLKRIKKYRWYTIGAVVWAILCTVAFFLFVNLRIYTAIAAIIGVIAISYTKFEQRKWIRLYENLLYFKKRREKIHSEKNKSKNPYQNQDKYQRALKHNKKKD